jgi:hypothetical protein
MHRKIRATLAEPQVVRGEVENGVDDEAHPQRADAQSDIRQYGQAAIDPDHHVDSEAEEADTGADDESERVPPELRADSRISGHHEVDQGEAEHSAADEADAECEPNILLQGRLC